MNGKNLKDTQSSKFLEHVSSLFANKSDIDDQRVFLATYEALVHSKQRSKDINAHVNITDIKNHTSLADLDPFLNQLVSPYNLLQKYPNDDYDLMDYKIIWINSKVHKYLNELLRSNK